ncbi:hypothetical protein AURDEDRAFT_131260, partial [Auricularia subglabra TFB-10046 SS5]
METATQEARPTPTSASTVHAPEDAAPPAGDGSNETVVPARPLVPLPTLTPGQVALNTLRRAYAENAKPIDLGDDMDKEDVPSDDEWSETVWNLVACVAQLAPLDSYYEPMGSNWVFNLGIVGQFERALTQLAHTAEAAYVQLAVQEGKRVISPQWHVPLLVIVSDEFSNPGEATRVFRHIVGWIKHVRSHVEILLGYSETDVHFDSFAETTVCGLLSDPQRNTNPSLALVEGKWKPRDTIEVVKMLHAPTLARAPKRRTTAHEEDSQMVSFHGAPFKAEAISMGAQPPMSPRRAGPASSIALELVPASPVTQKLAAEPADADRHWHSSRRFPPDAIDKYGCPLLVNQRTLEWIEEQEAKQSALQAARASPAPSSLVSQGQASASGAPPSSAAPSSRSSSVAPANIAHHVGSHSHAALADVSRIPLQRRIASAATGVDWFYVPNVLDYFAQRDEYQLDVEGRPLSTGYADDTEWRAKLVYPYGILKQFKERLTARQSNDKELVEMAVRYGCGFRTLIPQSSSPTAADPSPVEGFSTKGEYFRAHGHQIVEELRL